MRFLSDKTVEKAYNYALEVLAKVGIIFEKEEALDVFRNRGFKVEANKVFMNSKQIELALETLPKAAPEEDKGGSAVATSPFGNSPLILDHRTGEIRRGTLTDAINVYKLTETSPLYECSNPAVVDPEGLEAEDGFVAQVALLLKHTDKFPSLGIRATKATSLGGDVYKSGRTAIHLIREFYDTWDEPVMSQGICPMAPLAYDLEALDNIDATIDEKQSVSIFPCSLTYVTGPETLLGLIIHDFAVALAGLVYVQLRAPSLNVSFSECSAITDMRTMLPCYGVPENIQIQSGFYQICQYVGIPCSITGTLGDGNQVDFQSGAESMLTTLLPYFTADVQKVWCYPGHMAAYACGSFTKAILDEEVMHYVNRILQGVNQEIDPKLLDKLASAHETKSFLRTGEKTLYRKEHYLGKTFVKQGTSGKYCEDKSELDLRLEKALSDRYEEYSLPYRSEAQKKLLKKYLP